jgi:hypothetical protein
MPQTLDSLHGASILQAPWSNTRTLLSLPERSECPAIPVGWDLISPQVHILQLCSHRTQFTVLRYSKVTSNAVKTVPALNWTTGHKDIWGSGAQTYAFSSLSVGWSKWPSWRCIRFKFSSDSNLVEESLPFRISLEAVEKRKAFSHYREQNTHYLVPSVARSYRHSIAFEPRESRKIRYITQLK